MHHRYFPVFLICIAVLSSCGVNQIEETTVPITKTVVEAPTEIIQNPSDTIVNTPAIYSEEEYLISEEISGNMESAQPIIDALTIYQEDNLEFPETLKLLIPDYLSELTANFINDDFSYQISEPDGYILSFTITRMGNRWHCGYLGKRTLWDCSGDGSTNNDPANSLDLEGEYSEKNLVGYMNYNTSLTRIYDTIVIYRTEEYIWLDPITIREAQISSGFYEIGYHYVIGEDGTVYEGRDLNYRGNHGFPNYGRIGIFLIGDMTEEQFESVISLVDSLDYRYKLDYLYGNYEAPGIYPKRIPGDSEIEKINKLREIIVSR